MVGFTNVPLRGDAIWIAFNPQVGREQAGRIYLFLANRNSRWRFRKNRSSLKNTVGLQMRTVSKNPKFLKKHDNAFQVEWKDGHASWYPYWYLRQMCPCAECAIIRHKGKDVHSLFSPQGDGDISLIDVSEDIQPIDVQLVGRYALQFSWNDGHNTGIYPFEVLRETCPCPECMPLQPEELEDTN